MTGTAWLANKYRTRCNGLQTLTAALGTVLYGVYVMDVPVVPLSVAGLDELLFAPLPQQDWQWS